MRSKLINNRYTDDIKRFLINIKTKREINSEKYKMTNFLLCLLFPLFIVCMAELNQNKYPSKFILFAAQRPTVMLFNVLIAALIFIALYLLLKKGWLAMLCQSALYMTLSITELFKYNTNGNHLTITDMSLAKSLESLASFAYIKITLMLVVYVAVILIYIGFAFWFNPKIKIKWSKALVPSLACCAFCACVMTVPAFGNKVYALFDVDTKTAKNTFILNEKFENNGFLAFFMQNSTETVENKLEAPENYNKEAVESCLEEVTVPETKNDDSVKPNVVVVMSESYADFRVFDKLDIDDDIYKSFDSVCSDKNARSGYSVVPTYASYTVRTEFELMFGLPVKSLNDANMPQRLLPERKQAAIPAYYKANGYSTAYVHPYLSTFYGRDYIYSNYSFDKLIFEDDFTVDENYYGNYIDDASVFDQLEKLIKDSDKPMYIHTTTMQNHQPYDFGEDPDDQFNNYLGLLKHTGDSLKDFTDDLKKIDEPTIVFYIGDHFPSLRGDDSVYNELGITSENCSQLYEQHYALWANYDIDYSSMSDDMLSVFYMPYQIMELAGIQHDSFINTMLEKMESKPIYSTNYQPYGADDEELDMLTYDRILGDQMSDNPLCLLYPEEMTAATN